MEEKANSTLIKRLNEIRLLNLIREECPISRNELARRTKISKVAVSDIISRLIEAGYVLEVGKGISTHRGGKRPTMIKLNPDNGYVIGIEIKRQKSMIALANIESKILALTQFEYEAGLSLTDFIPKVYKKIDRLLSQNAIPAEKLISIGIGIPGFVNYTKGELAFADTLQGWAHLPLAAPFSSRYNVPVILENDANAITLVESLLGAGRGSSNLVCIWIGAGIGAGILVDGQLVRGATGNAGEFGYLEFSHFITAIKPIQYLYSNQRYFGEILSDLNLLAKLVANSTKSRENLPVVFNVEQFKELLQEGEAGNRVIREILDEYAYLLSLLCINIITTLNPSLIILSGLVIENSNYLLEKVRKCVEQGMWTIPFPISSIVVGELKEQAGVKGAIALALQTIFEPPVTKRKNHAIAVTA
ncbi:ROK family transcriptional regulator [candidate division KSB1 bacterium]|nr:ROK family transcriptional regulator [candidate division KSB1 bacterium]